MAYSEVSVYQYITGDDLEAYTGIDYSANNGIYTEAVVMAKVTIAERMINAYLGVSTAQTKTDGVIVAATIVAAHLMAVDMEIQATNSPVSDRYIINVKTHLGFWLNPDQSIGVDAIPMSGADR